jgi:phosphoribosylanthranilate isomerase
MAIEAGADALGFVFYPPSPRYITPASARAIIEQLPPFVEKVGLFVHETAGTINTTCKETRLSLAQLHWDVKEEFFATLEVPYLPVVRAKASEDIGRFRHQYRLVDAFAEGYGGAGRKIDSAWFEGVDCSRIILAGGLDSNNVSSMRRFGFYGFDVSSGVERSKGIKDPQKIAAFIKAVKA